MSLNFIYYSAFCPYVAFSAGSEVSCIVFITECIINSGTSHFEAISLHYVGCHLCILVSEPDVTIFRQRLELTRVCIAMNIVDADI